MTYNKFEEIIKENHFYLHVCRYDMIVLDDWREICYYESKFLDVRLKRKDSASKLYIPDKVYIIGLGYIEFKTTSKINGIKIEHISENEFREYLNECIKFVKEQKNKVKLKEIEGDF